MGDTAAYDLSRVYPTNGRVRPGTFVGGTNSRKVNGIEVEASLGADSVVELLLPIPRVLAAAPAPDLLLKALANATSGSAKIKVEWAVLAVGDDPDTKALNNEGTQTLTWAAGNNEELLELVVDLDAGAFVQGDAGKLLYVRLTFETTGWTLAALSHWLPELKVTVS